jgi:hypothetical protein
MTGAALIIDTSVEPEFFPPPFSGNIVIGFTAFDPPFLDLKPNSRTAPLLHGQPVDRGRLQVSRRRF